MLTKTIKVRVEVPQGISDADQENALRGAEEGAVLALWEAGAVSTRRAADELGLGYHEFLDLLAARGIPVSRGPLNLAAIEAAERKLAAGPGE